MVPARVVGIRSVLRPSRLIKAYVLCPRLDMFPQPFPSSLSWLFVIGSEPGKPFSARCLALTSTALLFK